MYKLDPDTGKQKFYAKDGTKSVISAIISILIGMAVGALIIIIVGITKEGMSASSIWDGIRLVFFGIFSTGREAGELSFGFNPVNMGNMLFRATPLIMTGGFQNRSFQHRSSGPVSYGNDSYSVCGPYCSIRNSTCMADMDNGIYMRYNCRSYMGMHTGTSESISEYK